MTDGRKRDKNQSPLSPSVNFFNLCICPSLFHTLSSSPLAVKHFLTLPSFCPVLFLIIVPSGLEAKVFLGRSHAEQSLTGLYRVSFEN